MNFILFCKKNQITPQQTSNILITHKHWPKQMKLFHIMYHELVVQYYIWNVFLALKFFFSTQLRFLMFSSCFKVSYSQYQMDLKCNYQFLLMLPQWSYKTTIKESQTFYPVFKDINTLKWQKDRSEDFSSRVT